VLLLPPIVAVAQNDEFIEVETHNRTSDNNILIQKFYKKMNKWISLIENKTTLPKLNKKNQIKDFVIFSEDGLIMNDLNFHNVQSCKHRILKHLSQFKNKNNTGYWLYIGLESHVSKIELIQVLEFFENQKIDYYFANDDELLPLMSNLD